MSLRKKDDWDEALEESYLRRIISGEGQPKTFVCPPKDYNYAMSYVFTLEEFENV